MLSKFFLYIFIIYFENIFNCNSKIQDTLDEDDIKLADEIESKLVQIHDSKFNLFKLKSQEEMALKVSSIKLVMERVNLASVKWLNEEFEKKMLTAEKDIQTNRDHGK